MKKDSEILREIAVDISNGRLLSRGTGIYLKKLADKLQQQDVTEEDIEIIKDLIEGVEELNGEYQDGWDDTISKAKDLLTKKLKGNGI